MKKTKLVTSYYAHHAGSPVWGQVNRDRWYRYSLVGICSSGLEVVCYTDNKDGGYQELLDLKDKFNLTTLTIKNFPIDNSPFFKEIYKIRSDNRELYDNPEEIHHFTRPTVVYWMKFVFLRMEMEKDKYTYWIDAGLGHHGLFPSSASSYGNEPQFKDFYRDSDYMQNEYKLYYFDKAFTKETIDRINKFSEDKVIHLYRNTSDDRPEDFKNNLGVYDVDFKDEHVVAGFFGGHYDSLSEYVKKAISLMKVILSRNFICTEQEIMTYINAIYPDIIKKWKFDSFYHEGWGEDIFPRHLVSFSDFFLKKLK